MPPFRRRHFILSFEDGAESVSAFKTASFGNYTYWLIGVKKQFFGTSYAHGIYVFNNTHTCAFSECGTKVIGMIADFFSNYFN